MMSRVTGVLFVILCLLPGAAMGQARASSYVAMDSWVYPVLDRMIARGEMQSDGSAMRPWTRMQIASLLIHCRSCEGAESEELRREFAEELGGTNSVRVGSVYARSEQIAGRPLTNAFDYGQTVVNDFGRPNREGQNFVAGTEAWADSRWLMSGVRVEYQQSGAASDTAERVIVERIDGQIAANRWDTRAIHRVRMLEGYAGTRVGNFQVSVGRQGLHWGPGYSGAMLMGENAEPLTMLRIRNAESFRLPWIFAHLGDWRGEMFVGKLEGHVQPYSPWLQGQKITLQLTPNLEFGFSRTIVFAGGGRGLATSFGRSFLSVGNNMSTTPGTAADVGDRRGGFDFQYRLPMLRNHVTLYADSFTDDDPSPLAAPHRSAFLSGLYFPTLPGLNKMDLRVESAYTDAPGVSGDGRFFYVNGGYMQSYTNDGQLLGHWAGRAGKAYQGWATYWFSTTTKAQFNVKTLQVSPKYLPGGGRQWDFTGRYETRIRRTTEFAVNIQVEKWRLPVLESGVRTNVSLSFQATYHPHRRAPAN
jgi:hypothetical protein